LYFIDEQENVNAKGAVSSCCVSICNMGKDKHQKNQQKFLMQDHEKNE
jgi:hypothetical protein